MWACFRGKMRVLNSKKIKKIVVFLSVIIITASCSYADELKPQYNNFFDTQTPDFQTQSDADVKVLSDTKAGKKDVVKEAVYIKDIEVVGTNFIKPEYVLNRLQLQVTLS